MKSFHFKPALMLAIICLTGFVACNKNNDGQSPANQIKQSESLIIPATVDLPVNAPAGNSRVATYYAVGVQKYKAAQKEGDTSKFVWLLVAPDAVLYDIDNKLAGIHYAGPSWKLNTLDSIQAQHFAPARTAPSTEANTVDWLLLKPKENGKQPTGIFTNVIYIQRIATKGGKAPAIAPTKISDTVDVPYTAVYRFSRKN